ncbi:MAG TPA: ABC transporter ATP-binding protein [Gammaproteobacteria bacterium]|nr:ABC transporter ATP-binding protein [Gammaproteobacteria bacterium]
MSAQTVIAAEQLTCRFGHFTAVDDIHLAVQRGEVFGLLGANGAGKTTTIRMLCGLLPPTAGRIRVAEVDMVNQPRRARGRIGYVTQHFTLYPDLTVWENLQLQAGLYGLSGTAARQRIGWSLEHLHLAGKEGLPAGDLPLGYKRRLSFAGALLHRPQALFLDEPTSGVDALGRAEFWELIYDLAEAGMGILVTTHYMDEAGFCDRLALMHAGRVVEEGTPASLLQRPLPTPLLQLRSDDNPALVRHLSGWPSVQELIPQAGTLRLRLRPGSVVADFCAEVAVLAEREGIVVQDCQPIAPELEDVFVTVLEEVAAAKEETVT